VLPALLPYVLHTSYNKSFNYAGDKFLTYKPVKVHEFKSIKSTNPRKRKGEEHPGAIVDFHFFCCLRLNMEGSPAFQFNSQVYNPALSNSIELIGY